jgi:DNA-binding NarL/FixJ family response regulator
MMGIRVLVCEERTLVQAGIRAVLASESDMAIVGETSGAGSAASLIAKTIPHVVLAGSPGDALGIVSLQRVRLGAVDPHYPGVVVMIASDEEAHALRALQAGARGVLHSESSPGDLILAIRAVAAGQAWLTPSMTRRVLDLTVRRGAQDIESDAAITRLSPAELRILGFLAMGLDGTDIARKLCVCDATVRSHIHHILTKLGLRSRSQAVAFAYRNGVGRTSPGEYAE